MNKYTVDGNTTERVGNYMVWRVMCDGEVVCSFYGSMSMMCAAGAAKALNEGLKMSDAVVIVDRSRPKNERMGHYND